MANNGETGNFLSWLGVTNAPNWKVARTLGYLTGAVLVVALPLLFLLALVAAFAVVLHSIKAGVPGVGGGISLSAGALIAALLGAPFLIWSTVLKHQTVRYQKEGHITDRINKAVEQLGAEKSVERIGRPVTVWTGKLDRFHCTESIALKYADKPRTKLSAKEYKQTWSEESDDIEEGYWQTVSIWSEERTIIQWQSSAVILDDNEVIGAEGSWQVFKETAPNIEVRIGAILSLERIAQDSTRYDNGRDHIRAMEILCAYIRQNTATPSLEAEFDDESPITPRTDIQIAIDVIKRRSQPQIENEAENKYRLDLRSCDFRGINFSRGSFRGAIFVQCRFEFANLSDADFSGARFDGSVLNYVVCMRTKFIGADMRHCRIDKPEPIAGGFVSSINMGDLSGLSLVSANISSIQYLGHKSLTFGTKDTELYWQLDESRNEAVQKKSNLSKIGKRDCPDEITKLQEELGDKAAFLNWSPHDGADLMTNHLLHQFRGSLSLLGRS